MQSHTCMPVHVYVCARTHIHTHIATCTYMHVSINAHMHSLRMYVHINIIPFTIVHKLEVNTCIIVPTAYTHTPACIAVSQSYRE